MNSLPSEEWCSHLKCTLCIGSIVYLLGIRQTILSCGIEMSKINCCPRCHLLINVTLSMPRDMVPSLNLLDASESSTCQVHFHRERFYLAKQDHFDQSDLEEFCNDCRDTIKQARINVVAQQLMRELEMNLSP